MRRDWVGVEAAREWVWLSDACAVGELDGEEWSPKIDSRTGFAVAELGECPPRRRVDIQRGGIEPNESESDWDDVDFANRLDIIESESSLRRRFLSSTTSGNVSSGSRGGGEVLSSNDLMAPATDARGGANFGTGA